MMKDLAGVRIIPSKLVFRDCLVNNVYKANITVQNVGTTGKAIRYYGPQNQCFTIKTKLNDTPIAAGLDISATIEYRPTEECQTTDRIVVTVDDDVIEVPILGYPVEPRLILGSHVDFGNIVAKSKVVSKSIYLYNHGSKAGDFKVKYTGDKPVAIHPSYGTVPPKSKQMLQVEYVAETPGKFDTFAKIKLEGHETAALTIKGNIVVGRLELINNQIEDEIECINFGTAFYGTDRTESATLFNNSPEPVCFVAILHEDAIGQEFGVDLTKSTAATLAARSDKALQQSGKMNDIISLVTAIPNQGMLAPYEKIPMFFRFSPRWHPSKEGFKCNHKSAPRKDFVLFMALKVVGASSGSAKDMSDGHTLEIPLKATAMPALISLSPRSQYNFDICSVGEHVDTLCTLKNECDNMSITFQFRRVAHFITYPPNGQIKPGQSQDVIFSFAPNQVGTFNPTQYIDVIGPVADEKNPFLLHLEVINSIPIAFSGRSDPVTIKKEPKFNPGLSPAISNEVGIHIETKVKDVKKGPRAAILKSNSSKLHRHEQDDENALVAFPNDRACSVRPSDYKENFQTIFTRTYRHKYVDPDYAYEEEEAAAMKTHRKKYTEMINTLRQHRHTVMQNKEYQTYNNRTDIAIKPAAGLKPKKLTLDDIRPDNPDPSSPNANFKLLSTKTLQKTQLVSKEQIEDGLNAVPTTAIEKADCSKILNPQQLFQIIIGPATVEFGKVCLKSVSQMEFHIINNIDQYIHVEVDVDNCRELRQTSPLSQVVPPMSKATVPLIFESNIKGKFQRSLDYTINGFYRNHFTVFAEVVPVSLELSTDKLILEPTIGLPAEAGIRGTITLTNSLNYPAEFTWAPIIGEKGTAFSIRPATGIVDAHRDLDCEVVFHPSYLAPDDGSFHLQVHGGSKLKLYCKAHFGTTNVFFIDRRINFGQVPLNLITTRTALIKNNSLFHGYFQVLDPNPFPGMAITPMHGVVPVGGMAEVRVHLHPSAVIKFDTRVRVAIRGWKTIELRMGGTVEPPSIDLNLRKFNLGGVHVGSTCKQLFKLLNNCNTRARVEFDLSRYLDFSVYFPEHHAPGSGYEYQAEDRAFAELNPGVYTVLIEPEESLGGELIFKPTEVASYDFIFPVTVNQMGAPTPNATPYPPTPEAAHKNTLFNIVHPKPKPVDVATPRKRIVATALRQPLQVSDINLSYELSPTYHQMTQSTDGHLAGRNRTGSVFQENPLWVDKDNTIRGLVFVNTGSEIIHFGIDTRTDLPIMDKGVFKFLHSSGVPLLHQGDFGVEATLEPGRTHSVGVQFCPEFSGFYKVVLPIILDRQSSSPYMHLSLTGELKCPTVTFDPLTVIFAPVPLDTEISVPITIKASNYTMDNKLTVTLPEVECDDGSMVSPISIQAENGLEINACCGAENQPEPFEISCILTFKCAKPISFTATVIFKDTKKNKFPLTVTGNADNCLLTCYPFLAMHRTDHHIICEQGHTLKGRATASRESVSAGEAILVPCEDPNRAQSRPSTTATSSNFEASSSSYEGSTQSDTDSSYPYTPRDGAVNKPATASEKQLNSRNDLKSRSLGSALFPEEDTEEGIFHTDVLLAVQRWFSSQGWPGGPYPITIPYSLRSGITKKGIDEVARTAKGTTIESNNVNKEFKTVYDMVGHLCGKPIPGIPVNGNLPSDSRERVKQVHWQHKTMLSFLRAQGASIASIKPEYLMEPFEYKRWIQIQIELEEAKHTTGHREKKMNELEAGPIEEELFEAVSKRAWTDVLLQLLKVFVISKITPRQFKNIPTPFKKESIPQVDPNPLCSNVYSISERIVLLWLNYCYEQMREQVWSGSSKGGIPASRWIVNFDFDLLDGLVLAAVLAAHSPFLIETHLQDMYTQPATSEQCLHNALKVVSAMRYIGIEYDIQAIDITDPNPVCLLLLSVHLYKTLPSYIPRNSIEFQGGLHAQVNRQVKLTNPSVKPLIYHAMICGRDAQDFTLTKGDTVTVPRKSSIDVNVEYLSRFLRPAEAVLVFAGRRQGSTQGTTLAFTLRGLIDDVSPKIIIKCESPCYKMLVLPIEVKNPFNNPAEFKVAIIESHHGLTQDGTVSAKGLVAPKKMKPKEIKSKIDSGMKKPPTPEKDDKIHPLMSPKDKKTEDGGNIMLAFSCKDKSVFLEANGTGTIHAKFLPFSVGKRQCSIVFINEQVGEFLYSIDATGALPEPCILPFSGSQNVRISSAVAANRGRGQYGGNESVMYYRCEVGKSLKEQLDIPITNQTRESALIDAALEHMSDVEKSRRQVTGTLASGTITAKTIDMLSSGKTQQQIRDQENVPEKFCYTKSKGTSFSIEIDSKYFKIPSSIVIPNPVYTAKNQKGFTHADKSCDGSIALPINFFADKAGHYPCQIVLRSPEDVRRYLIEVTVTPEGTEANLNFRSPVHQPVTQNIPVINKTDYDWPVVAKVQDGWGFTGPRTMTAKANTTSLYPLVFKPHCEGIIKGTLVLKNTADDVDFKFNLLGKGERPLPLEKLNVRCTAKNTCTNILQIPNVTQRKLHYLVETDIKCVNGKPGITVLPSQTGQYELLVAPLKRGVYTGVITFTAGVNPVKEVDSDGDEMPTGDDKEGVMHGYKVWYEVEIIADPSPAEKVLELSCPCQKKLVMEVGVSNPLNKSITLTAEITGHGLTGQENITLGPKERGVYELLFFPAIKGQYKGSLIFYQDVVGEFWYDLNLNGEPPVATRLRYMECELGRWIQQPIVLNNPTDESLELIPTVSNTNNFNLERDNERPILLGPLSSLKIPLTFLPSTLGPGDHKARITFHCEQLGEWIFLAEGSGLLPQPQDPVSITSIAGSNSTLIIPLKNPLDIPVLVDIVLKDKDTENSKILKDNELRSVSPFVLLLKHAINVRVGPKVIMDIPISFAPELMRLFEAEVVVTMRKENGSVWEYSPANEATLIELDGTKDNGIHQIKWSYPIHGYPELQANPDSSPALVTCRARDRVEERLEVTLSGVAPCSGGPSRGIKTRSVTPLDEPPKIPDGVVVGDTVVRAEEFAYELIYIDPDGKRNLENTVALKLIRQYRDKHTGLVVLIYSVVYAPYIQMRHDVHLLVKGATGGIWKFPLRFVATESDPDDNIIIESLGLNRESSVHFKLHSQVGHPAPYEAFFVPGSDAEFTVLPSRGELLPTGTDGTLIQVKFLPTKYGKIYQGRLVVTTADMQWNYSVKGVIPDYIPPHGNTSVPKVMHCKDPRRRGEKHNFLKDNLRLATTAVSSPLKGAPLMLK